MKFEELEVSYSEEKEPMQIYTYDFEVRGEGNLLGSGVLTDYNEVPSVFEESWVIDWDEEPLFESDDDLEKLEKFVADQILYKK